MAQIRNVPTPSPRHHGADAAPVVGEQVEGEGVVPEGDVRAGPRGGDDGPHHFETGRVPQGVDDAAVAVPAFARQRETAVLDVELRPPGDELLDFGGSGMDHTFHDLAVAQSVAGDERVLDVVLERVLRIEDAREPALRVRTVALGDAVLGDDQHGESGMDFEALRGSRQSPRQ